MKTCLNIGTAFLAGLMFISCESVYHINTTEIEVLVPATVVFPDGSDKIAVRYNNINIAYNPFFAEYLIDSKILKDTTNLDSTASKIYFESFLERIKSNPLFEQVVEIEPCDYSTILLSDSLVSRNNVITNASMPPEIHAPVEQLTALAGYLISDNLDKTTIKYIDPEFGLYSEAGLSDIADSTNTDMLLSHDFFVVLYTQENTNQQTAARKVYVTTLWNFYDLKNKTLPYYYLRTDTVTWEFSFDEPILPERVEAVKLASEISGNAFADFLVPNWINVERVYYQPWNKDLKITRKLIADGDWRKAAGYWKPYTKDKNKRIASWSMFNMALAAEMENQIDAAIDWVVQSYHLYGKKDEVHKEICEDYIKILSQRKQDIKLIDIQFTRDFTGIK